MCASVFYCTVTRNKLVIKLCKSERASSLVRARDLGFGPNGPNFTEILPFRLGPRQNKIGQNFLVQFEFYTQSTSLQTSLHISRKKHTLRLNSQFIPTIYFFNHTNQTRMTFIETSASAERSRCCTGWRQAPRPFRKDPTTPLFNMSIKESLSFTF